MRSRPLSVASIPDLAPSAQNTSSQQNVEDEMSRKDITASLGAKDPSWFRQTADRGRGSAAYRKNEHDSEPAPTFPTRGVRLPGMSSAVEDRPMRAPVISTPPSSPPKSAFAVPSTQRQPPETKPQSTISTSPGKSPALDLPAFKPLDLNTSFGLDSPGPGRTSSILSTSGRPPSPTKGLGGFVESAMMKRSDSVSKRWSVQANAGLKRGDSVASNRPGHLSGIAGYSAGHTRASSRDVRGARDGTSSPLSGSRPVSSHGEPVPITKHRGLARPDDESAASPDADRGRRADSDAIKTPDGDQQPRPVTPLQAKLSCLEAPQKQWTRAAGVRQRLAGWRVL